MGRRTRGSRALVVAREGDETDDWCETLDLWGFDAIACEDIERALCVVADLRPVALVLDLGIPGCDALDLVAALRAHDATSEIAIVAVTDVLTHDVAELALGRGCDVVVSRPIDVDELAAEVERHAGSRGARRAVEQRKRSAPRAA
jgi:DNA-binding response OmpR family regulator